MIREGLGILAGILGWAAIIGSTYWVTVTYGVAVGVVYGLFGSGFAAAVPMLIVIGTVKAYDTVTDK